jgi:hypothetical protein
MATSGRLSLNRGWGIGDGGWELNQRAQEYTACIDYNGCNSHPPSPNLYPLIRGTTSSASRITIPCGYG